MQRFHKYLSVIVLLALSQTACDLDFTGVGEGFAEGLEHVDDFDMGPWPSGGPPIYAIRVRFLLSPDDSLTASWVDVPPYLLPRVSLGTISEGSYVDSLRLQTWGYDGTHDRNSIVLVAGDAPRARRGTYHVTIAAPGYVAWDTTGVVVQPDSNGIVQTVQLPLLQLVEVP